MIIVSKQRTKTISLNNNLSLVEQAKYIIKTVSLDSGRFIEGCYASYYRLNKKWGFKVYEYSDDRNLAYFEQRKTFSYGLAPAVRERFKTLQIFGKSSEKNWRLYGYITENVIETVKDKEIRLGRTYDDDYFDEWGDFDQLEKSVDGYTELCDSLIHYGFSHLLIDLHWENVGWLADGRLVAIDFL
jgi:hypothetical protein